MVDSHHLIVNLTERLVLIYFGSLSVENFHFKVLKTKIRKV